MIQFQEEVEANFAQIEGRSLRSPTNVSGPIYVKLNWGVAGLDRSSVKLWDPNKLGELIWDEGFAVAPVANQ